MLEQGSLTFGPGRDFIWPAMTFWKNNSNETTISYLGFSNFWNSWVIFRSSSRDHHKLTIQPSNEKSWRPLYWRIVDARLEGVILHITLSKHNYDSRLFQRVWQKELYKRFVTLWVLEYRLVSLINVQIVLTGKISLLTQLLTILLDGKTQFVGAICMFSFSFFYRLMLPFMYCWPSENSDACTELVPIFTEYCTVICVSRK